MWNKTPHICRDKTVNRCHNDQQYKGDEYCPVNFHNSEANAAKINQNWLSASLDSGTIYPGTVALNKWAPVAE